MIPKLPNNAAYICGACAHERGGELPENYAPEHHRSFCDICRHVKQLASVKDYDWQQKEQP